MVSCSQAASFVSGWEKRVWLPFHRKYNRMAKNMRHWQVEKNLLFPHPHTKVKSGLATWDYTWGAQNQCENKNLSIILKYQVIIKCYINFETNIINISICSSINVLYYITLHSYVIYMVNIATKLSSLLWQLLLSLFCFFSTYFSFQQFFFF